MKRKHIRRALGRSIALVAATLALVGGVTYAALQSQPGVFKGSTIDTAIASLQVSTNGTTYASSIDGYAFSNLIPGGQPTPSNGYPVYVKNAGSTALGLRLAISSQPTNPNNVDLTKIHVVLTTQGGGGTQSFTLAELIASQANGGLPVTSSTRVSAGQTASFVIQVSLDSDAITGPSASLSNIDFSFGGLAVN